MKKLTIRPNDLIFLLASFIPLFIVSIFFDTLPKEIVMNVSFDGSYTYSNKNNLFLISLILPIAIVYINKYTKDENGSYKTIFKITTCILVIFMTSLVILQAMYPDKINLSKIMSVAVNALVMVIANYIPKIRHNSIFAFKTKAILKDKDTFNKIHRLYAKLMFFSGFINLILSFLLSSEILFYIMIVSYTTVFIYIYFYNFIHKNRC